MPLGTVKSWALLLAALLSSTTITTALQVTPNSPCASLCLDPAGSADPSTPNIHEDDIVCSNRDYAGEKGQKFQGCMNCLQNSTYSQGSQNDQAWFMYNLQYAFAHCVFGYPNGTGIGSYPCMTSEACGPLKSTVSNTLANNTGTDPFAYCRYKGGSTFGDTFGKCLDCMGPDTEHGYVTNYFVALEAGCEQRPTAHGHIALNDTLFANRTIGILNLNSPPKTQKTGLSTGALIAIIVVSVIVGLLLIGGCVFLHIRRRRNRYNKSALEYAASRHLRGASSMDFQCATHVNPFSPGFRNNNSSNQDMQYAGGFREYDDNGSVEVHTATAVNLHHHRGGSSVDEKGMPIVTAATAQEKQPYTDALRSHPPAGPVRNFSHKQQQQPSSIDTTSGLARPEKAMTSPMPYSPDSYMTPSSTTSATPFLAAGQSSAFSPTSPRVVPSAAFSPHTSSPLVKQQPWEETGAHGGGGGGLLRSKASKADVNAPVAARQLQTKFPPPPKR